VPADTPIRLGVLGAAAIARRLLPRLVAHPDIQVVAVASRDRDRAEDLAATVPAGIVALRGYEALLKRSDLDAVYVCLPPALHPEWTMKALDAGVCVLVEKPMAPTWAEATAMSSAAAAAGRQLWENRMFAHHAQHDRVRELVAERAIGDLRAVHSAMAIPPQPAGNYRYSRELGGGALLDVGYYAVHGALAFLCPEVDLVGSALTHQGEVDVGGGALLVDRAGVLAHLTFGFRHFYRSYYELWGSAGRLVVERAVTPPADFVPHVTLDRGNGPERVPLRPEDQFGALLTAFAAAVRGGHDDPGRTETTLCGARLLDAIRAGASGPCRIPLEVG
jgi:NDP-hexose-3-ketoreductase